jgi:hypothetical protein
MYFIDSCGNVPPLLDDGLPMTGGLSKNRYVLACWICLKHRHKSNKLVNNAYVSLQAFSKISARVYSKASNTDLGIAWKLEPIFD